MRIREVLKNTPWYVSVILYCICAFLNNHCNTVIRFNLHTFSVWFWKIHLVDLLYIFNALFSRCKNDANAITVELFLQRHIHIIIFNCIEISSRKRKNGSIKVLRDLCLPLQTLLGFDWHLFVGTIAVYESLCFKVLILSHISFFGWTDHVQFCDTFAYYGVVGIKLKMRYFVFYGFMPLQMWFKHL